MYKFTLVSYLRSLFALLLLGIFASCETTKKVAYFQDINAVGQSELANTAKFTEPLIQADDIISISIFTIDDKTGMIVNQVGTQAINTVANQTAALGATPPTSGFLIDKNGEIDLSVIGKVKLIGLTTYQARELIKEKAAVFYTNPNVQVRFANFKVTILGEVARPATYVIPNEKVSVLDALGLAGDLTIFGRRENIKLVRDNDGKKEFAILNLNSKELFKSPYYYLKQNDVLYVEPNKGKAASLNQARTQTYALIGTIVSVLIVLITRF
ncbi:polysaccharide biosynthesis/export family protein [Pedobacter frigiditerrae]|uniref:polysaccharide biosynthesis/export family protein n=1 Tax=Pedobacter frigiditerrae TaxID=2530452 RepID=UPI0029300B98|nr:polysaccharide biosynthesis/export family protein [Pedobacter frigiditerrae]